VLRYAIVAKNFVISNGSPGRLAKILLSEKIYRKNAILFMARAAPAGGQGLRG
jgi:hypothetical protein